MEHVKRLWQIIVTRRAFGFIACLILCAAHPVAAQTQEEPALRALLERFFAAYQKEEISELMALWSKAAPDLPASEQAMRRTFAENEKIQLRSLTILNMKVEGDKALARVLIDIGAVEAKTGKDAPGFGKMSRTLYFVKEKGEWKVWRYISGEEELAADLTEARTEEARSALLQERKEALTVGLLRELIGRGRTLYNRGEFVKALDTAGLTLKIAEQMGNRPGVVSALILTGSIYVASGDYTQALSFLQKGLALAEALEDKLYLASALMNLGNVYDVMGDGARAEEYYQRTLNIARETKNQLYELGALNNLGNVYGSRGDRMRELEYYQKSLKLAEELKNKEAVSMILASIGVVYSAQGSYQQALEFYRRSLALHEELGLRYEVPRLLGNIGLVYFKEGKDYNLALEYQQKALKLAEEVGDKEVIAGSLNMIGDVYVAQGDYQKALEYYRRGLTLAEAIGNKVLVSNAWGAVGYVYLRMGEYRKALEHAERAIALARQSDLPSPLWWAYNVAGQAHLALNRPDLARRSLSDSLTTIDRMRELVAGGEQQRERFFENKVAPYYAMVELSLSQGNDYEALAYGDRAKSRVLSDVLSGGRVDIMKAMTVAEQERERALQTRIVSLNRDIYREKTRQQPDSSRLASLNGQLQKARLEYEAFETSLYAAHPELKLQRGEAPALTPERIGELLPDSATAFLEFVVSDEKSYLFALTRSAKGDSRVELKTYRLAINGKELAARVKDFRRRLAERDPEFREAARALYDLLLKPAAMQLRGKSLLGIIPDGVLWELPFQALQPTENRHLIEDHALFYAPSLGVLYGIQKMSGKGAAAAKSRPAPTLLAFGNPAISQDAVTRISSVMRDERLDPLPEAEREVKTLREIYKPANSRVYVGTDALEARAKAEMDDYRVLHFATHGILDDLNPMYSHLVLSLANADAGEDGLLHAWEVMRLDLKADVVVLSACQTARGHLGAGEGVLGMSWALFVAGSPTTVASQWSVESSSTTQLMVEFHRNLLSSTAPRGAKPSKAEALRRASLSVLKNSRYAHPFYWAGFIMIGDGARPL
ncbi:MAG TPA: CHAT domain-containing protein [Pyrinomonadaceae bacterium]|jgi:CHAT domain-containing protein/Tfp pilus assembly protein PilF/ketosteroid isomerase-like protein